MHFFLEEWALLTLLQNEFLVFEEGPSQNMTLQWATYRDASDQTSLSRIWGGIHPPIDDIRGRKIGEEIGIEAFNLSLDYFNGTLASQTFKENETTRLYPIPFKDTFTIRTKYNGRLDIELYSLDGKLIFNKSLAANSNSITIETSFLVSGFYFAKVLDENNEIVMIKKVIKN